MTVLITGGAGFIGSNLAQYYLKRGELVIIFDNFSRSGSKKNAQWLRSLGGNLQIVEGDVTREGSLTDLINSSNAVFHLAGQVAVTASVDNPRKDLEINLIGTFNVLESIRNSRNKPILVYSSTNKVYGEMEEIGIVEKETRYDYKNLDGISEKQCLDFHSPYGCSKGAADQYVHDYSRIYDLKTVVLRQSCIYGPRQFGVEDQGWVAWFIIALVKGQNLTIYGNGKQVRDILYISDLTEAYDLAIKNIDKVSGQVYNIGGGRQNTISVWHEFAPILEKLFGKKIKAKFSNWRPGDQKVFISDTLKAKCDFGWQAKIGVSEGIGKLYKWVSENKGLFV